MHFKLANVLFNGSRHFQNYPTMLFRFENGAASARDNYPVLDIARNTIIDFTTYINALSTLKWKRYTVAKRFYLHFEYLGSGFTFKQCCANDYDWSSRDIANSEIVAEKSDRWTTFDIELSVSEDEVLHGFSLACDDALSIRNAYYYTNVDESLVRDVELALATTTFKKESYIIPNIELIKSKILDSDEQVATHFTLHVIDNGRTISPEKHSDNRILIHPNPNVGGSGGFAKGMIEAMEQTPKASHVLLMDDDVEVVPESIIRSFNLLSLANDEYKEAFLSGAMMSLEEPNLRTEDLGYFTVEGKFSPLKPSGYMTNLHDVVETEAFQAPADLYPDTSQQYAGWWFCSIPISVVERNGLPLPLFVRSDDAEYALRCKPKFMTMNGICVWHNSFYFKYSAAVERYQVSRNTLISQATTGIAPMSDFAKEILNEVQLDLKKFNYDDAELAVKGFEDFLRGPEFIMHPIAESRFMEANREREPMIPLSELAEKAKKFGVDLHALTHSHLSLDGQRSTFQSAIDYLTFNGQRISYNQKKRHGKVAVVDAAGWTYPAGKIREAETIIVVDMPNRKGAIRHIDPRRFKTVWKRYKAAKRYYEQHKDELFASYAARKEEMTSVAFWKKYLEEASK